MSKIKIHLIIVNVKMDTIFLLEVMNVLFVLIDVPLVTKMNLIVQFVIGNLILFLNKNYNNFFPNLKKILNYLFFFKFK
jgi:hypothetical protein